MVPGFRAKEIKPAKSIGQRLKAARKRKQLSLEEAERQTKVKLKYLQALEDDRHDLLPTEVYSLGFLRCYGEVLELNTVKLLEQYQLERRTFKTAKGQGQQTLAPKRRLIASRFLITPKILFTVASLVLILGLVAYIASGVHSFLAPPVLTIDQPQPDSRVTSNTLEVIGTTDPAASLTINGEIVTVSTDGKFKQTVAVLPGLNTLDFIAVNHVGKETTVSRKILADYEVPPTPIITPSPSVSPEPSPGASPAPSASPSSSQ